MSGKPMHVIRRNGIYYTPEKLASLLADNAIDSPDASVLDPSCGEGALLAAAARRCQSLRESHGVEPYLCGCDKLKHKAFFQVLPKAHFVHKDFFGYSPRRLFNTILMNPPFIAMSRIPEKSRGMYRKKYGQICNLSSNADVWVYFIIKSVTHLTEGGNIGAIFPWSFLQAEYGANLRKWLAERFKTIRVLVLTSDHFPHTTKRVLLVWLEGYGKPTDRITIGFSANVQKQQKYRMVSRAAWCSGSFFGSHGKTNAILSKCRTSHGFRLFGDLADIRIGIVTGANAYFIPPIAVTKALDLPESMLVPILTRGDHLRGLSVNGENVDSVLLKIPGPPPDRLRFYLREGEKLGVPFRSHSMRRDPWYYVDPGIIPDAFFHYRVSAVPFLVLNEGNWQCTNSIHRVYFRNLTKWQRQWAQISLLSIIGQLSLETFSRVYGNGILKVEPYALKQGLVFIGTKPMHKETYKRISILVSKGRKWDAVQAATEVVQKEADLPAELIADTHKLLREYQGRRL